MNTISRAKIVALAILGLMTTAEVVAAGDMGTLSIVVRPYDSTVKINKKIRRQLDEASPFFWGADSNSIIVSQLPPENLALPIERSIAWGEEQEIQLPPGSYAIICVGYVPNLVSTDPEENLEASAFVNEQVFSFTIDPGEVTRLEVTPTVKLVKKKLNWAVKLKLFYTELALSIADADTSADVVVINARTDTSVGWDEYDGFLKP